jgi:predicted membrane channel-forming protein YqfA (hemolysin III family)
VDAAQNLKKALSILCRCAIAYGGEIHSQKYAMSSLRTRPVVPAAIERRRSAIPSAEFPGFGYRSVATQTPSEELANTSSAALGLAGAFGFALALLWRGDATVGQWVFAVALLILFLISTAYHGLIGEPAKEVARILDHVAIFVLIAATYTPFALGPLRAHGGILLFALEWLLALIGLCFVLCGGHDSVRISNALYIGMGWL